MPELLYKLPTFAATQNCMPADEHYTWQDDADGKNLGLHARSQMQVSALCPAGAEVFSAPRSGAQPLDDPQQGLAAECFILELQEAAPAAAMGCGTGDRNDGTVAGGEGQWMQFCFAAFCLEGGWYGREVLGWGRQVFKLEPLQTVSQAVAAESLPHLKAAHCLICMTLCM